MPTPAGLRFLTWYDYSVRFGAAGRLVDSIEEAPIRARLPADCSQGARMTSIYQRALGSDFSKLHPEIQRRFSLTSEAGTAAIGIGTMDRIWHGAPYTLPFLYVGTWRSIMFPEHRRDVPFSIQNYAYLDPLGRETVTWVRTFSASKVRRFDAYMIYSEERGCIVDYLGTHQHLAVDLEVNVAANGGLHLRSGAQRFYEGPAAFSFPLFFSGIADVCEWYDDQEENRPATTNTRILTARTRFVPRCRPKKLQRLSMKREYRDRWRLDIAWFTPARHITPTVLVQIEKAMGFDIIYDSARFVLGFGYGCHARNLFIGS
ncbi:MAG: DUF4166 domain-containing protein [Silvibacterium sp.]